MSWALRRGQVSISCSPGAAPGRTDAARGRRLVSAQDDVGRGAAALLRGAVPAHRDRLDLLRAAGRAAGGAVGRPHARRVSLRRQGVLVADGSSHAAGLAVAGPARGAPGPTSPRSATSTPSTSGRRRWTRRGDGSRRPCDRCTRPERLGAVLFQYPPWFGPRKDNRAEIEALRERLPDYRVSVEFRSPRWTESRTRPRADAGDARGARAGVRRGGRAPCLGPAAGAGRDQPGPVHHALPRPLGQHLERHLSLGGRALSLPLLGGGA